MQDDKAFNMDAAEKGGLKMRTRIFLDEDLFSLEKRAFFSQVSRLRSFFSPFERDLGIVASSSPHNVPFADDSAVLAFRMPS